MEIRKANITDAFVISEVLVSSWRYAYKGIMPDSLLNNLSVEAKAEGWKRHLAENPEAYLLEDHERTLGIAEYGDMRDSIDGFEGAAEIYLIYLYPDSIGRGYGAKLMHHCLDQLRDQDFESVAIWVLEENTNAIAFYEQFSFTDTGISKVHQKTGLTERLYSLSNIKSL